MPKQCTTPGYSNPLRARGLCSTHYNRAHQPNRHTPKPTSCTVCGTPLMRSTKSDRRPVCSASCRKTLSGHKGTYNWATDAANRARRHGATVIDIFTAEEIFVRDNWTCNICHTPVDRHADPLDRNAPSIDHVKPLAKGGTHTRDNTACTHLRCNSAKQDALMAS